MKTFENQEERCTGCAYLIFSVNLTVAAEWMIIDTLHVITDVRIIRLNGV